MSKFKMKMKLSGFEIEIEGDRGDAPGILTSVRKQLGAVITPGADVIDGAPSEAAAIAPPAPAAQLEAKPRRRRTASAASPKSDAVEPLRWAHDAEKWGYPVQGWTTAKKCIWLLGVLENVPEAKDKTTTVVLAATFNKNFKDTGEIMVGNINRDLGREKGTHVAQSTQGDPKTWSLMQKGRDYFNQLVAETRKQGNLV